MGEEGSVELGAGFEEEAEDVALGESGEEGRKTETARVARDLIDFDAE